MLSLKAQKKLMEGVVAEVSQMPVLAYQVIDIRNIFYDKITPDVMLNLNIQEERLKAKEEEDMRLMKEQESMDKIEMETMDQIAQLSRDPRELRKERKNR